MNCRAYHRPTSIEEALELAAEVPDACFIAGGTDLLVKTRRRPRAEAREWISLRRLEALRVVECTGDLLRIGAGVALADLANDPRVRVRLPALAQALALLGSRQIRNVATLGGNLCNASPGADTAPPLLVYGARVELRSQDGLREVPLAEFFRGPGETVLVPGEMLTAILVELGGDRVRSTFLRKARVSMDIAIASLAVSIEFEDARCGRVRIAAGAVAPRPLRLEAAEGLLEGTELSPSSCEAAIAAARAGVSPIDDLRAQAWYRTHLVGVLLGRALVRLKRADALASEREW